MHLLETTGSRGELSRRAYASCPLPPDMRVIGEVARPEGRPR